MVKVIDASVAIKWFIEEPGRDASLEVLSHFITSPKSICVPELFYFELTHVFGRLVKKPSSEQVELMKFVLKHGVHRFALSPDLYDKQRVYQKMGLSGYDACYVAVADLTEGIWLTFDRQAHKKVVSKKLSQLLV